MKPRKPLSDDERAKATEEHILAIAHIALDAVHHFLHNHLDGDLLNAGLVVDFAHNFCFCHDKMWC